MEILFDKYVVEDEFEIFFVGELMEWIKGILELKFFIVWVCGEIFNFL